MRSSSEHWVTDPKISFGAIVAYGISSWDMPDGHRLRREMSRSSEFRTLKEMQRWAKKYGVNIDRQIYHWQKLSAPDSQI